MGPRRSSAPSRPQESFLPTSTATIWETIAFEAERESSLWAAALRPMSEREELPIFSPLAAERFALGVESIYEGYLLHYGRPRLFAPADRDGAVLLGDYLYAHGLVRITALGDVEAVRRLAELLSLCAHLRAEAEDGDGQAWADTIGSLGDDLPSPEAGDRALALHADRVD
jgi:hypothetical protein